MQGIANMLDDCLVNYSGQCTFMQDSFSYAGFAFVVGSHALQALAPCITPWLDTSCKFMQARCAYQLLLIVQSMCVRRCSLTTRHTSGWAGCMRMHSECMVTTRHGPLVTPVSCGAGDHGQFHCLGDQVSHYVVSSVLVLMMHASCM